jgi:hypothetical protein
MFARKRIREQATKFETLGDYTGLELREKQKEDFLAKKFHCRGESLCTCLNENGYNQDKEMSLCLSTMKMNY